MRELSVGSRFARDAACPWCGTRAGSASTACTNCGKTFRTDGNTIDWTDGSPSAPARTARALLRTQLNPVSSRLSPLRWISDWRVHQYYRRTLHDAALASRWSAHYLADLEIPPASAVLDHGCGRGRHVALLQRLGFIVSGQDVAAHPWWSQLPQGLFQVVPPHAPRLPWQSEAFVCVIDVMVLHYVPDGELSVLAREIYRVLRPGGYWILAEANDRGYGAFLPRRLMGRLHTLARMRECARNAGFLEVDLGYEGFYAPVAPRLVNLIRKQLRPGEFDLSDFDSSLAAAVPPEKRAMWRLRLRRPL